MKRFLISLLVFVASFTMLFGFCSCDLLDSITGGEEAQVEEFDRTPYIGTYYFSSYTYEDLVNETTAVHNVGEEGYPEDYITLEIKKNSYTYINEANVYIMGEWKKDTTKEKTFNFYDSNGVLAFSATIEDGTFTRVVKDSALSTTEIYTYVLKK